LNEDFIRVRNSKGGFELQNIRDILSIDYRPDFSIVRTRDGEYELPISKKGLIETIIDQFDFIQSDRDLFVNIKLVKKYHSTLNYVFFDNIDSVKEVKEKNLPYIFLHPRYVKHFRSYFGIENDLAYKKIHRKNKISYIRNVIDEILNAD